MMDPLLDPLFHQEHGGRAHYHPKSALNARGKTAPDWQWPAQLEFFEVRCSGLGYLQGSRLQR